jgi:hypothetical protein
LDGRGSADQLVDFGELVLCEAAETFVGGSVPRTEEVFDLVEAEAGTLGGVDNHQASQDAWLVAPLAAVAGRRVNETASLVLAQTARGHRGQGGELAD